MFNMGLLDKDLVLCNLVDLFDKVGPESNQSQNQNLNMLNGVKIALPLLLNFIEAITQSHFISRKLAWPVCRYLNLIYSEERDRLDPSLKYNVVVVGLSAIIQCIVLECPSSLVSYPEFSGVGVYSAGNIKDSNYGGGSPLDICPTNPSNLPLHPLVFPEFQSAVTNTEKLIREELTTNEKHIIKRSIAVENHWSCDKWRADPAILQTLSRLINYLDYMDNVVGKTTPLQTGAVFGNWEEAFKCDPSSTDENSQKFTFLIDEIYFKIFEEPSKLERGASKSSSPSSACITDFDCKNMVVQDAIIGGLCQWAICTERRGLWRATLVAKLLEKRQDFLNESLTENPIQDQEGHKDSGRNYQRSFHTSILKFLETAPILKDPNDIEELISFQHLMLLIGELIRHDIFNYTLYLNMMICNNDFVNLNIKAEIPNFGQHQNHKHGQNYDRDSMDIDSDVQIDSSRNEFLWGYGKARHVQYVMHIPLIGNSGFDWMEAEVKGKYFFGFVFFFKSNFRKKSKFLHF